MDLIPFAWPREWNDTSALELIRGTPINCVLIEDRSGLSAVIEQGEKQGLRFLDKKKPPDGVRLIEGVWPGIRISKNKDTAEGGPTGVPWVDSNAWALQLARAQTPDKTLWVSAVPDKDQVVHPETHIVAAVDSASMGGFWVVYLEDEVRKGLERKDSKYLDVWKRTTDAIRFFGQHKDWAAYQPYGVLGVVSDFAGGNEFMSTEVLNLTARQNQPFRILPKASLTAASLKGLVAVIYPDDESPAPPLRKILLDFAASGGTVITGPKWGQAAGEPAGTDPHPRFQIVKHGKGRLAIGTEFDDPFVVAADSRILMSHRHDLVRFWNAGSMVAYYTMAPDGRRAVVHMINYSTRTSRDLLSARIAGPWRSARLWTVEKPEPVPLEVVKERNALELHLPAIPIYGAVDLVA